MEKHAMYYDMLVKVTNAISQCNDPEEVALITAESVKTGFKAKGCSVFLVDRDTREMGLAASFGLSQEYLTKGPVRYMQEIGEVKDQVPIAIYDVLDDPRIQYPQAAKKEGISSLLGFPSSPMIKSSVHFACIPQSLGNFPCRTSPCCRPLHRSAAWPWTCAGCTKDTKRALKS